MTNDEAYSVVWQALAAIRGESLITAAQRALSNPFCEQRRKEVALVVLRSNIEDADGPRRWELLHEAARLAQSKVLRS